MRIRQIHLIAYRGKDAKEAVDFYERVMNIHDRARPDSSMPEGDRNRRLAIPA